jgi:hypothetical protein
MDGRTTGAVRTKRVEEVPRGHEPPEVVYIYEIKRNMTIKGKRNRKGCTATK